MRRISRSSHKTFSSCRRKGYNEYLYKGSGLRSTRPAKELIIGLGVHKGLEVLLHTGDIGVAVEAARTEYEDHQRKARLEPPYLYEECGALVEALVRGWHRTRYEDFLEEYEVLFIEVEMPVLLSPGLTLDARADAVVKRRSDGLLFVWNWKCLRPEQSLTRVDGTQVTAINVKPGERLLAWNGQKIVEDTVKAVGSGGVQPTVEVVTNRGRRLRVSRTHPFLVCGEWVPAGMLRRGDELTLGHRLTATGTEIGWNRSWLTGLLVADGGLTGDGVRLSCADEATMEMVRSVCNMLGLTIKSVKGSVIDYTIHGFHEWLHSIGLMGKSSWTKSVPPRVFAGTLADKAAFLAGYFQGDGYVGALHHQPTAYISTVSYALAEGVQELFLQLGVDTRQWERKTAQHEIRVGCGEAGALRAMAEVLRGGGVVGEKARRLERFLDGPRTLPRDYVQEVLPLDDCETVAIEMETFGTFVTSGVVSHNTTGNKTDWTEQWEDDIQMWTEALSVEDKVGPVAGVIVEGLFKGSTRNGQSTSPLLMGYTREAGGRRLYRTGWEKGWTKFPAFRMEEGLGWWIDFLPLDVLGEQFVRSQPILKNNDVVRGWVEELVQQEVDITHHLTSGTERDRELFFWRNFSKWNCRWCPFKKACKGVSTLDAMVEGGLLAPREDHHKEALDVLA